MNRNKSQLIQPHNPITNPLNLYNMNPYANTVKKQIMGESSNLYRY